MKRAFIIAVALLLTLVVKLTFAAEDGEKGASSRAYERASEQSIFHRVSDWFATIGKSPEEKAKILEERRTERATKRTQKEIRKFQKKMEKIKKQEESVVIRQRERKSEGFKTKVRQRTKTR